MSSTAIMIEVKGSESVVRTVIQFGFGEIWLDWYCLAPVGEWLRVQDGELYLDKYILPARYYSEEAVEVEDA